MVSYIQSKANACVSGAVHWVLDVGCLCGELWVEDGEECWLNGSVHE